MDSLARNMKLTNVILPEIKEMEVVYDAITSNYENNLVEFKILYFVEGTEIKGLPYSHSFTAKSLDPKLLQVEIESETKELLKQTNIICSTN